MQRETWQQHFFPPSQTRERLHLTSSLQEVWSLDLRSYLWVFHKHSGEQEVAGEQLSPFVSNGCSQPRCNTIKVKRVMVKELIYICLSRLSRLFFCCCCFPPLPSSTRKIHSSLQGEAVWYSHILTIGRITSIVMKWEKLKFNCQRRIFGCTVEK